MLKVSSPFLATAIDYDDIMKRLFDVGYEGWVIIEATGPARANRWNMPRWATASFIRRCMMLGIACVMDVAARISERLAGRDVLVVGRPAWILSGP